MFVLSSDITIGTFRFKGVNNVVISRSMYSLTETARIHLPSICKIVRDGKADPTAIITGKQFNVGDPVIIKLGYNGILETEFKGFVKRCDLKMPLEVECEGYSWLLKRSEIKETSGPVSVKNLLNNAVSGIPAAYKISVQCEADIMLNNVSLKDESGFDVISNIAKYTDGSLSCFFIKPNVLWCGYVCSSFAQGHNVLQTPSVNFRIGYNVEHDNNLKVRTTDSDPVQVVYSSRADDGNRISQGSDVFKKFSSTHNKVLSQMRDALVLNKLAVEKAYHINYAGYEGYINGFLQPYCGPGYTAFISDSRYPERNGTFLVESVETSFGLHGARRKIEMGIQLMSKT